MTKPLIPLVMAVTLAGCAADRSTYPSLAPRPIEKLGFAEPAATPVTVQPDPALDGDVATAAARLDAIAKGFDRDAAAAADKAAAAQGQAVGSDAWLAAQTALTSLDDWHAQSGAVVSDLEQRALDRAAALQPAYPALDALTTRAHAEADRQATRIHMLEASLPAA